MSSGQYREPGATDTGRAFKCIISCILVEHMTNIRLPKAPEHREVWRLAGPLILSNISIALLGLVDTAVVGHLNRPHYLGAIAVAAVIFDFLYWGMGFLRMGTTGIVAQVLGTGNPDEMRSTFIHATATALFIALTILIFQKFIIGAGLYLVGGTEDVKYFAGIYFNWAIWATPAVLMTLSLFGWLLGMQNAKAALYITVTLNIVNVVLDIVFVYGFDMNVRGVALATVVSEYTGLVLACYLCIKELQRRPGRWRSELIISQKGILKMLVINRNIFIRTICLIFVFAFFTSRGARQGDVILAANSILLNFQTLMALALDGFANAAEALVGKSIGAGNRNSFIAYVKTTTYWALLVALGFMLLYACAGKIMICIMTDLQNVRITTFQYLPWMILSPLVSVWCFQLDGIFIGATRTQEMRDMMLLSTFLVFLPAWYLLQSLGNHGLWLAFMLFFIARAVTLIIASIRIERREGFVSSVTE